MAEPAPPEQPGQGAGALAHVAELERKVASLQAMRDTLQHLAHCCHGDDRPECPILDRLADDAPP